MGIKYYDQTLEGLAAIQTSKLYLLYKYIPYDLNIFMKNLFGN